MLGLLEGMMWHPLPKVLLDGISRKCSFRDDVKIKSKKYRSWRFVRSVHFRIDNVV